MWMNELFKVGVFIVIGVVLNRIIDWIFDAIEEQNSEYAHLAFFKRVVNVVVIVVIVYSLAQQFEVTRELSTALLQSGSLIIAIATFAAQHALSNVISGFSISFTNPYSVGDKIRVTQGSSIIAEGIVTDITLRHTIINQYNGESCIVPNSVIDSSVITNTNFTENVGNFMEVTIAFYSDIRKAMEILQKICIEHKLTLNTEENTVTAKAILADGVALKTTVWTKTLDDNFQACSDIRIKLIEEFQKNNIVIPYQTVIVRHEENNKGVSN